MTAIAALTITDSVPVNRTFSPVSTSDGIAMFAERSGGIPIGYPVLSISLRDPLKNGPRNYKLTVKLVSPTLEVTSPSTMTGIQPAPTKAFEIVGNLEFVIPERSTLLQRQDAWAMFKDAIADAVNTAAIENFEHIY